MRQTTGTRKSQRSGREGAKAEHKLNAEEGAVRVIVGSMAMPVAVYFGFSS